MNYETIIEKAKEFARIAHEGQFRNGKPYIAHPIAVMEIAAKNKENDKKLPRSDIEREIYNEELFIIKFCAIWHDLEDTKWDRYEGLAIEEFGLDYLKFNNGVLPFKREILTALILLNKNCYKNYRDYILSVKENDYARAVKIADLEHNMSDLKEGSLKDKYRLAEYILTH